MNKILIIAFIILIVIFGVSKFTRQKVGDLRPAFIPSSNKIAQSIKKGQLESPNFPLKLPSGFTVGVYADSLPGARDIAVLPAGVMLVSQTSKGTVTALWQKDGETQQKEVLSGLKNPHGIAFYDGYLYIAEEEEVVRYTWDARAILPQKEKVLFSLPKGGRHFTRSLAFNKKGQLFITVGSTCDVCVEKDERIAILLSDKDGTAPRVYAKGLRNSPFITINPKTDELWATEMGRDFLGDETPPDEINIIQDGKNYGWPYCYGNKIYDTQFGQETPAFCNNTIAPVFEIPSHSAPLGLTFIDSKQFPEDWQGDLLVAYHGSWNRSTPTGYKVVRMNVEGNKVTSAEDFLTGFITGSDALGRPVDVAFDTMGDLYVSDDKAGAIYKISKQ